MKFYKAVRKRPHGVGDGAIHGHLSTKTRPAPKIIFVGAFDTVKAVRDDDLYDLSFNRSIDHFRHSLALNERRAAFSPEYEFPELDNGQQRTRSFLQAWFVGAHMDIGGSSPKDGLSLLGSCYYSFDPHDCV